MSSNDQQKARIIVLGPLPPPFGGPEVMTQTLLNGLLKANQLEIKHLNTQVSRSLAEKGGRHQGRKSLRGFIQVLRLISMVITFRPDIVYLPLTNSPSFLGFLRDAVFIIPSLLLRRKVAIRLHGGYYFYAHTTGLRRKFVQFLLSKVNLVMVQGDRLLNVFDGLVPSERIVVIPNGIDDKPFAEARSRVHRDGPQNRKHILFVGLMCREKGFRDVLSAVPCVLDAEFVFAGEWPSEDDKREVLTYIKQQSIEDRVKFVGVVSGAEKYELFLQSDIFVFPSYFVYEGHAVSSVEALAAGLPIVCTEHGALNESVEDGVNGFFVTRSNPEAISFRLNQLINDDDLRISMGKRSRDRYENCFTLQHFISNWTQAIINCANSKSQKGYPLP